MLPFIESPRFNTGIRYGTSGGPEFNTDIITVSSGAEQRNANWAEGRGRWDVTGDGYNQTETDELIAFFRSRRGKAGGFRFKDWSDWRATTATGVLQAIPGSTTTMQLVKKYVSGADTVYRKITKPVTGTVIVYSGSTPQSCTIDYTTGIVTIGTGTYTWEGEFDVPARFDTDSFRAEFAAYEDGTKNAMYVISGLTIVELR